MSPRVIRAACVFSALVWVAVIVCLAGLFFSGCASEDVLTIPRAPAWIQPQDARHITGDEVRAEAARLAPMARLTLRDDVYSRVSRSWLEAYVSWTWGAEKAVGIHYTPESFDCEDFASLFTAIARTKAAEAGQRTAPLIGIVIVRMEGTARHALVLVATDKDLVVVEPQPDAGPFRIHPLSDYAGRIDEIEI